MSKSISFILRIALFCLFISTVATAAVPVTPPQRAVAPSKAVPKNVGVTPAERLSVTIDDITVVDHGTSMSWYAKSRNRGNHIAKDQLEVRAYQMLGNRVLGNAGPAITSVAAMSKGDIRTFTRQNWQRISDAAQIKVVITDKRTHQSFHKTVALPKQSAMQPAKQNSGAASQVSNMSPGQFTDPQQTIEVEDAFYRGRGAYSIRLKNIGNRGVLPKQLALRPFYHVKNKPVVVGTTATNLSGIVANGRTLVSSDGGGIYASGMAECGLLQKVVIEIKNPLTGQLLEHPILIERPQGKIVDVDMHLSNLAYTVKNTGPYRSKFRIRMLSITLYNGKYDRITALKDLFHTTITLNPGEVVTASVPRERVNAELKAKYPPLKKKFYGADHYQAELYTEYESNYCRFSQPLVLDQANFNRDIMGAGEEILVSD